MSAVRVIRYRDWAEFKRDLFVELYPGGVFRPGQYLFHGAGDANWRLSTSFDRRFAALPLERRMALWEQLIGAWQAGCSRSAEWRSWPRRWSRSSASAGTRPKAMPRLRR